MIGRPKGVIALCALEALFGVMGIISGLLLILEPSGELLGFTSEYREKIPFQSFFLVGVFLFSVYGVGSFVLSYGSWTRKDLFLAWMNGYFDRHWSWTGGMLMIVTLVVWLVVEGYLIGLDFAATYFTMAFGAAIFLALMLPSVRRYSRMP